jgi:hypothetical protein
MDFAKRVSAFSTAFFRLSLVCSSIVYGFRFLDLFPGGKFLITQGGQERERDREGGVPVTAKAFAFFLAKNKKQCYKYMFMKNLTGSAGRVPETMSRARSCSM